MVWTIGDMAAGETRTLHYQVMLKDDYVGAGGSNDTITNAATPKSKTYEHNTATSTFTPQTKASVTKKAGDVKYNRDEYNTITIPYMFTVTADSKNTWPVKHLKISDDFGLSGTGITAAIVWDAITATHAFPSLGFQNFQIRNENQTWSDVSAGAKDSPDPYYVVKQNNGKENPGFNFYFGEIKPGQTVQMKCELTMKPAFSSSAVTVNNRGTAYSSDRSSFGNKSLGTSAVSTQLEKYTWDRKVQGAAIDSAIRQSGLTSVYTYSNSAWRLASSAADTEVPAGSIQYRVVVNEKGSWDVSSAAFSDVLGQYLQYAGYLRLDYYKSGISSDVSGKTDAEVADTLSGRTPDRTVWLDINGMTSFNFSPGSLSSDLGQGAYLLTYYAAPVAGNFSRATSGNSFTLSGSIVWTGRIRRITYTLPSMSVRTSTTVSGSLDYSVKKEGWYYDSKDTSSLYQHGKLYWVVTVSGSKIPAGVQLLDKPLKQPHHTTTDSIAGIYLGAAAGNGTSFTEQYDYFSQIEGNKDFSKLGSGAYRWSSDSKSGEGVLTFQTDVEIPEGKQLYIILTTAPNESWGARDITSFQNQLYEGSSSSQRWVLANTDTLSVLGEGTNFKELGSYGAYDSTTKTWSYVPQTMITNNNPKVKILTSYQSGGSTVSLPSGTYAEYRLVVNYGGNEQGSFRVEDIVPDGMEPVYIRCFWIPDNTMRTDPTQTPTMPEITDLGGDWTDIGQKNTKIDGKDDYRFDAYAYYSAESHKILFDVGNLHKGTMDQADIQVQVVMRVTDPEALMGKNETFVNTMNVYRPDGSLVSTSSVSTAIQIPSIEKSAAAVSEGTVPFTITVNPRGEDLLPGSDTLTLVDEMAGNFTIDPVDNSQWNISLQKGKNSSNQPVTTMTLALPDSQKLTVTYRAEIDAAPDTDVTYSNKAYWQGYQEQSATTITGTVKYSIDGSISMSNYPEIRLVKVDQSNASKELSGARFSLYLAAYDQDTGKWGKTGKPVDTQTTASSGTHNGILTFRGSKNLLYNTVYCIVEDKAPNGYVKSTDPVFIAMARKDSSGKYSDKSTAWGSTDTGSATVHTADELKTWASQGVIVNYRGSVYTYTAVNQKQKTSLKIDKTFLNRDGSKVAAPSDGTFSFGLYNSRDSKVGTLTIRYQDGTPAYTLTQNDISQNVTEPVFQSLNVGDSYKVYELDGDEDPITDGRLLYNKEGKGYIVRYQGVSGNSDSGTAAGTGGDVNTVTVPDSAEPAVFGVTNQEFKIPVTGVETEPMEPYRIAVWLLVFAAATFVILSWRRRARRKW